MKIAVIGATGLIGQAFLKLLVQSNRTHANDIFCVASCQSAGKTISCGMHQFTLESLEAFDFTKVEVCFFAVNNQLAKQYVPIARQSCILVIDNSSAFRQQQDVPLIIPEVNFNHWHQWGKPNLIANPNCTTVGLIMAIAPIHKHVGIERMDVATYQAISGAGAKTLESFNHGLLNTGPKEPSMSKVLDAVPVIDSLLASDYTKEEIKLMQESQKILDHKCLHVSATAVRVPVHTGHGAAVTLKLNESVNINLIHDLLCQAESVMVYQEPAITPRLHAHGSCGVHVARIRRDLYSPLHVHLWVVSDNILRGGAYNAFKLYQKALDEIGVAEKDLSELS